MIDKKNGDDRHRHTHGAQEHLVEVPETPRRFLMNRLSIDLQNCYGIKKLAREFDFSQTTVWAVYAPNGSMKSSFAQTFKDIADDKRSLDRIFPSRTTVRLITDENGTSLPSESVLVLPPYDEFFSHTEKTSTLLVNNTLRKEHEKLHADLDVRKASFLRAMKAQSGSKKPLAREIALTFTKSDADESFYQALERISAELKEQSEAPFAEVKYDAIFDDKILAALDAPELKAAIQDYIIRYNQLLDSSTYFRKGVFEYYNATQIAKTLASNGFFEAKHTVTLHATEKTEIQTQEQLQDLVQDELNGITKDKDLKERFDSVKKKLERNVQLRDFQRYLCDHELLLPHLANIDLFKEQIWKSYFKVNESLYDDLLNTYRTVKTRRHEIEQEARKERTQWEAAIDLFNERFFVPFRLEAKNKAAVALGHDAMLDLQYTFRDGRDEATVQRQDLLKSLSQGEKKALYILNIIFDVEVRRRNQQETLFVVDDIADSFDYKNKYAIIQYLQDISEGPFFKQIVLTHNFDFFRTVASRFVGYGSCLTVTKTDDEIELSQAVGIRNPFLRDWRDHLFDDGRKRVASIAFTRNLIEHTRDENDDDYTRLTSLLHWKENSALIKQRDLDDIYRGFFGRNGSFGDPDECVVDLIEQEALACLNGDESGNLESKVVLSIAIRLAAEKYMVGRIADAGFVRSLGKNQTQKLLRRFETDFGNDRATIGTLRKVVLMTPENIHLNAFMYEPILDMSDDSLRTLYAEVRNLR